MESLPQNPDFKNIPENFHQCTKMPSFYQPSLYDFLLYAVLSIVYFVKLHYFDLDL